MNGHFSSFLMSHVKGALAKKEQVILFQNRRGYSPVVSCNTCGHTPDCPNCDVSLTFHQYRNQLRCHYCSYMMSMQTSCGACGGLEINSKGFLNVIDRIEKGWQLLKDNTNRYLRVQNLHRQDKPLTENTICYIYFNVVRVGLSKKLQGFFLGPMIITERYSNSLYLVNLLDSCPIKSKKPIVVARDKIYPIDTKLELCPKEWVSLDLKPSEYIHPDDCVMLDKMYFIIYILFQARQINQWRILRTIRWINLFLRLLLRLFLKQSLIEDLQWKLKLAVFLIKRLLINHQNMADQPQNRYIFLKLW